MKRILISVVAALSLAGAVAPANAHGWRGGYGGWHGGAWAPFVVGAAVGVVGANMYYRPAPVYYPHYYGAPQRTAAYCPENGLYYPQTQACPSGWQQVAY